MTAAPMNAVSLAEVFRSLNRADCEERAFVLTAVGIPNRIEFDGWLHTLVVEEPQLDVARSHLARYALESRPLPVPPPPPPLDPFAWVGCVGYALTILFIGYAIAGGFWRLDSYQLGAIDAARVQAGEWWRALTALTLHAN